MILRSRDCARCQRSSLTIWCLELLEPPPSQRMSAHSASGYFHCRSDSQKWAILSQTKAEVSCPCRGSNNRHCRLRRKYHAVQADRPQRNENRGRSLCGGSERSNGLGDESCPKVLFASYRCSKQAVPPPKNDFLGRKSCQTDRLGVQNRPSGWLSGNCGGAGRGSPKVGKQHAARPQNPVLAV